MISSWLVVTLSIESGDIEFAVSIVAVESLNSETKKGERALFLCVAVPCVTLSS